MAKASRLVVAGAPKVLIRVLGTGAGQAASLVWPSCFLPAVAWGPGGGVAPTHDPSCHVIRLRDVNKTYKGNVVALRDMSLDIAKQERQAELDALKGADSGSWGNQMRSYVLNPYQMVKDLRTEHETGNPAAVFDGQIDDFIEAGIRWRRQTQAAA